MRFFNTEGPMRPDDHYTIDPLSRVDDLLDPIRRKRYFALHAPRQTGTTSALIPARPVAEQPRDGMADAPLLEDVAAQVGATLHRLETADHGYKVLKRTRSRPDSVFAEMAGHLAAWLDTLETT